MQALSGIEAVVPPALATDSRLQDAVTRQLRRLAEGGAMAVLAP
jgi:hypothetical protein